MALFCNFMFMKTRQEFHKLIDTIDDDEALKAYYQLISVLHEKNDGELWNELSFYEKMELLASYGESFDKKNLMDHNVVMEKYLNKSA